MPAENFSSVAVPVTDDLSSGRFTWSIQNFSKLAKKVYSDDFNVGGYKWCVDFCPYFLVANASYLLYEWQTLCGGSD